MAEVYTLLGRRIQEERKARHFTQQELAEAAAMDTGHLSRIEHGKAIPSISVVKRLADVLGVPIARLFSDIPPHKSPDDGWAGKLGAMVKEMPPKRRDQVLRVLKALAKDD
ncbi:MAG: helix-turn-helix transcriptional regulator [Elusimicrobia bacterium]|nr:helix-turn-helix transcriptional regulator [Elusimicrobiota bacterium]